ncbi:MAG: phosphotransferase [Nitrospirota bacterium]
MDLSAFILAAGRGERLWPITDHIPKPLLPILGEPVLQSVLEKISRLPLSGIGINLHHKGELIERWVNESPFRGIIKIFPENSVLGTGGALKNAKDFLKNSTFLVHNSDIISDIDLKELIDYHLSSENLVTLAVHDYPEFNNLEIDEEGYLLKFSKYPHSNPLPSPHSGGFDEAKREMGSNENPPSYFLNEDRNNSFIPDRSEKTNNNPSLSGRGLVGRGYKILAFTGIAIYSPGFLKFLPDGVLSVVDAWLEAISAGCKIGIVDVSGCYWRDVGTPDSYAKAVIEELRGRGETVYIDPTSEGCERAEMDGYIVIERDCSIRKNVCLRNCIMLPGTCIEATNNVDYKLFSPSTKDTPPSPPFSKGRAEGLLFENRILGPGFQIDLNEEEMLESQGLADIGMPDSFDLNRQDSPAVTSHENVLTPGSDLTRALLIGIGGSDRKYFRVRRNEQSVVLMKCAPEDEDFHRHIEYTRFFARHSVPVPQLIDLDIDSKSAVFEDLGDLTLYSWLKCFREEEEIERVYRRVIDALISIHCDATEHVSECPLLIDRIFDYEYLRWETNYFMERFVKGVWNIPVKHIDSLNDEFHRLAQKVDSFHKTVIHRDFQSQNIMITSGEIPRILDYQGARIGPCAYDVVSLLWDPYYRLSHDTRERLLGYYIERVIPPAPPLTKGGTEEGLIKSVTEKAQKAAPPLKKGGKGKGPKVPPLLEKGGRGDFKNNTENLSLSEKEFRETLIPCRLQRHMQALGAYGFLARMKNKTYFLKYVPAALTLLKEEVSLSKSEYPELYNLVHELLSLDYS